MSARNLIKRILSRKILLLDGAVGTQLQKKGLPLGVSPELWCRDNPLLLEQIHQAYALAGSHVVYTATFGANRYKLSQYGCDQVREVNRDLAALARRAVPSEVFVAGSIGPTGHLVEPFGDLPFEEAVTAFGEQVEGLLSGGVDLFAIETMMDIQEARAALIALRERTDHFCLVTITLEENGRTLGGTDPVTALITLQSLGADAVGINCSAGPREMARHLSAMKPYATVPLAAKPNAGLPELLEGKTHYPMGPEEFARYTAALSAAGGNILGGCCGTSPEHIRALSAALKGLRPPPPRLSSLGAVSSPRSYRLIGPGRPLLIIGERINPTGKKELEEELRAGKMSLVRKLAREQEREGADLLDVNVGAAEIDEAALLPAALAACVMASRLPLVIDSANPGAVEAALRLYPGRALVNSITLEEEKLEKILPLAARYGAMIVILPLTPEGIPERVEERKKAVRAIYAAANRHGYGKDDVVIDCLVLTAAANVGLAREALALVAWCRDSFGASSLFGLTNISFGLPGRPWLNGAYLAMAMAGGLVMAIGNPKSEEVMRLKLAGDLLTGRDDQARAYLAAFRPAGPPVPEVPGEQNLKERIFQAVVEGDRERILPLIEEALATGTGAEALLQETLIPAISRVGKLYEDKVYFLPQLMASAETMQAGVGRLEGLISREDGTAPAGTILLATVRGDIHDIGKNLVALFLRNCGCRVIDLGKDVSPARIIAAIREHRPDVVGLSALMTTTMTVMKETVERVRAEGLCCPFLVGGAVVTSGFAALLDAFYAKDAVHAVRVVQEIISKKREEG